MTRTIALAGAALLLLILLVLSFWPKTQTGVPTLENARSEGQAAVEDPQERAERARNNLARPSPEAARAVGGQLRPANLAAEDAGVSAEEDPAETPRTVARDPVVLEGVDGGLLVYKPDAQGIRDAVRAKIADIQECYEAWLKMSPKLEGKIAFSFAILATDLDGGLDPEGLARVGEVGIVTSSMHHPFMEGCVAGVFEDLRFERPEKGRIDVTYPLAFSTGDAG